MSFSGIFSRRFAMVTIAIFAVAVIAWLFAFEPVTRNLVASEAVCSYCHLEQEYVPTTRLSYSSAHPVEPEEGEQAAQCVDCHLPEGFLAAAYTYTHILSATDLFGGFRDRASERSGDWIPAAAARAYRVRDRLFEYDSVTCRSCHIESEIKPKRKRGQKAHKNALENKETCIECHDNLVHRQVDVRLDAFQKPEPAAMSAPMPPNDSKGVAVADLPGAVALRRVE
jgi:nitrate/TMAO reductase-like tetraheme cytochrome c subunit